MDAARSEVPGRHARRRAAVRAAATLPGLLVTSPADVRYLSGFTGSHGWLLIADGAAILVTDPRYAEQAAVEAPGCTVKVSERGLAAGLADLADLHGPIGYQTEHLSVASLETLREVLDDVEWIAAGSSLATARSRKEPPEVEAIRSSLAVAESGLRQACAEMRPGHTELEAVGLLELACRRQGAERMAFETIVASGAHAALPHARPRDRALEKGDVLLVDLGCVVDGYCSDVTRMLCLGEAPETWRRWHRAVDAAVEAALAVAGPGVAGREVDEAARRVLAAEDLADRFVHGLGHGVGIEVHEAPRLSSRSDDVLAEGMVVTVEPGVYLPGQGGVRLEDMILVVDGGVQRLNGLGRQFLIAGDPDR